MHILQVITPSRIAGAERSTASLCEHLTRAGHSVTVACKRGHPLVDLMREQGIDVRPLPIGGKMNFGAGWRLAKLAREARADVIHTHLSTASVWGSIAGHVIGVPVVSHVRALNSRSCYLLADRLIAVSEAVRDHLVSQGMQADLIDVVYSGMDEDRYYLPCTREEARKRLDIPPDAQVVAVVAHLTARKGHSVILDALSRLAPEYPRLLLLFAGEGGKRDDLEALTRQRRLESQVRFLGYMENVLPLYAAIDLLVLPSVGGEGLPRTLLEAGFLGLPTIGTRLSGVPEIIEDGRTGVIVHPGDSAALAGAIRQLLDDAGLRQQLGQAARERVRARFTLDRMVEGTLLAYAAAGATDGRA